jgi:hypothetical protein
MSYGQNLPWGLRPTRSLGAATWNSQTSPYLIRSGYNNNIFKGDPVCVAGPADGTAGQDTGYIISLYDVNGNNFVSTATIGVFDGCSYITPTATNPIDPASPGRQYWPKGTVTLNNVPAVANIVDDPNTIFNVQTTNDAGASQEHVGAGWDFFINQTGGAVIGNTNTGQSSVSVTNPTRPNTDAAGQNLNVIAVAIVPTPPNPTVGSGAAASNQFNNIEVLIQNHQYIRRAAPRRL